MKKGDKIICKKKFTIRACDSWVLGKGYKRSYDYYIPGMHFEIIDRTNSSDGVYYTILDIDTGKESYVFYHRLKNFELRNNRLRRIALEHIG